MIHCKVEEVYTYTIKKNKKTVYQIAFLAELVERILFMLCI